MNEERILRIINKLPASQRSEARYRIEKAHLNGVTDIGLWTGEEPADISDLVGNVKRKPETFTSREGVEIVIDTTLINLSRYSSYTEGTEQEFSSCLTSSKIQKMKVKQLQADNFKRLKVINITPTDNVIIVSGENEQGKMSFLDVLQSAFAYRAAKKNNTKFLRAGKDIGHAGPIDLGDYIVTRTFSEDSTSLKITKSDVSVLTSQIEIAHV